jgi:predicted Zn-dependent protease with MMP-like domain
MAGIKDGWAFDRPPSLEQFDAIAREAFDELPDHFRRLCGNVAIHVAEQAERDVLRSLGIGDPLALSGLYEGAAITQTGVTDPLVLPNHIHLYRRSIIAEWRARGDVTLKHLINHVLVHEIGHHFGLSDEDMHAVENREV